MKKKIKQHMYKFTKENILKDEKEKLKKKYGHHHFKMCLIKYIYI